MAPVNPAAASTTVVKTAPQEQAVRIVIGCVMALGGVVEVLTRFQPEIQHTFPSMTWLGQALLAAGLVARMLQELLLVFNIHTVKTEIPRL